MTKENKKEFNRRIKKDKKIVKDFLLKVFGYELLSSLTKEEFEYIYLGTCYFFISPFKYLDLYDLKFDDSWPEGIPILLDSK